MKKLTMTVFAAVLAVGGCSKASGPTASASPGGGDLVPIKGGCAYAELLANSDTGEVLVNTWDKDLKTRRPIAKEPTTLGSGDDSVELAPHPTDTDTSGTCSRFCGTVDWVRGGGIRHGRMHGGGAGDHRAFDWSRCWQAGQAQGPIWEEMGEHRCTGQATMKRERRIGPASCSHVPQARTRSRCCSLATTGGGVLRWGPGTKSHKGTRTGTEIADLAAEPGRAVRPGVHRALRERGR